MGKKGTLTLAAAFFAAAGLLPLLALLLQSLFPGGRLSLSAYEGILASPRQWTLLGNSFGLAALVTFFSSALGVPLGILLGRTDLPFRRLLLFLFLLPLLVPPYVTAVAWFDLLGKGGLLSPLLGPALTSAATDLLFGLPGCVLVLSTVYLPIPMLLALFFLQTVNPRLEEAARLSARWPRVLAGVTLPLVLPALLAAALLVFLLSLGEFSVPNYLRFPVFPTESFTRFSAFYDFAGATASALPLALAALVLLGGEALFLDKKRASLRPAPGAGPALPIPLGRIKNRLFPAAALLLALLVLLPFSALLVRAGGPGAFAEAFRRGGGALFRSLLYASLGALLLSLLGFLLGYLVHSKALPFWRALDWLTLFLFALPGTVLAVGLISLWNRPWTNFVYATPLILLLGWTAKYTALTSRIVSARLSLLPPSMEEAARAAGAGWGRTLLFVTVPLAARGILAAWLTAFLFCLRETSLTMMVHPPGMETLPVRIFTLMANGSPELIAALCVILAAAILLPAALLFPLMSGKPGKEAR